MEYRHFIITIVSEVKRNNKLTSPLRSPISGLAPCAANNSLTELLAPMLSPLPAGANVKLYRRHGNAREPFKRGHQR